MRPGLGFVQVRTGRADWTRHNSTTQPPGGRAPGGILNYTAALLREQLNGQGQYKGRKAKGEQATQLIQLVTDIEALLESLGMKN